MTSATLCEAWERTRRLYGARPALITREGSVSYAELDTIVTAGTHIKGNCQGPSRRVLVDASPEAQFVIDCWRVLLQRHVVVPIAVGSAFHSPSPSSSPALDPTTACILQTSGSTGTPKAVRLSHRNLLYSASAVNDRLGFGSQDRWLLSLPPFHIGGFSIIIRCAVSGGAVVIPESLDRPSLYRTIVEQEVTHLSLVPAMVPELLTCGPLPTSVRVILLGGQAVDPALRRTLAPLGERIVLSYGATETSSMIASGSLASLSAYPQGVGTLLPGMHLEALFDGRLRIKGPAVALGYDDGSCFREGWYNTPDAGSLAADGILSMWGRLDDVINTGGKKVDPTTIQDAVKQLGYMQTTVVIKGAHRIWGESPLLIVEGDLTSAALTLLEQQLREILPAYAIPKACVAVPKLPTTGIGKIDRQALLMNPNVTKALEDFLR